MTIECNDDKVGGFGPSPLHPSTRWTAAQMSSMKMKGANERTSAMLKAFEQYIIDFIPPRFVKKSWLSFIREGIEYQYNYLRKYRRECIGMQNGYKWFVGEMKALSELNYTCAEFCEELICSVNRYIDRKLVRAAVSAGLHMADIIKSSPCVCVMTYGHTCAVRAALRRLCVLRIPARLVIVDTHPHDEGKEVAQMCLEIAHKHTHVDIVHTSIAGASHHIADCTKVIIGASAILGNGSVVGKVGSTAIALLGKLNAKPVYVVCETYKKTDKIYVDASELNEMAPEHELYPNLKKMQCSYEASGLFMRVQNPIYDLTPADLIERRIDENGLHVHTHVSRR